MIAVIAGTTAEFIKMAPVRRELESRGGDVEFWTTAQHSHEVEATLRDLGLPMPERSFVPVESWVHVARSGQVPGWAWRVMKGGLGSRPDLRRALARDRRTPVVLVHGDTFSTVLGTVLGRALRAKVGHVEAGLRSGSLLSPLPEEGNRRVVGRLADIHFAPTDREMRNLRGARGIAVETGANTVVDSLRYALESAPPADDLPEVFGLATLHRFELLRQPAKFEAILRTLHAHSRTTPIVLMAAEAETGRIDDLGLRGLFDDRFQLRDKLSYSRFLGVLVRADFVVTDSGGLQEECAALGVPCAVHRERTERHQGLGENVVLTGLEIPAVEAFLADWASYRRPSLLDRFHPSRVIADTLQLMGAL